MATVFYSAWGCQMSHTVQLVEGFCQAHCGSNPHVDKQLPIPHRSPNNRRLFYRTPYDGHESTDNDGIGVSP